MRAPRSPVLMREPGEYQHAHGECDRCDELREADTAMERIKDKRLDESRATRRGDFDLMGFMAKLRGEPDRD